MQGQLRLDHVGLNCASVLDVTDYPLIQHANGAASGHEKLYAAAFRKLYFHLYSNSNVSRAERLMTDLSNLLLCRIVGERLEQNTGDDSLRRFIQNGVSFRE